MNASTRPVVVLEPDMPSHLAIAKILQHALRVMEENEPGLMADGNTEFLHDFRVAIRRTRTALDQFRGMLPQSATTHFQEEFAWLGKLTGPVRDLDVYLMNFVGYQEALPPYIQKNLLPLHVFLTYKREGAHRTLVQGLRSSRYQRFKQDWREFLDGGFSEGSDMRAMDMANRCIARLFRHILQEGGAIQERSPPEALHELRKHCKKLRYLIEFFRTFYPRHEVSVLVSRLKHLQDNLGEIHDLVVEHVSLKHFGKEMREGGNLPAPCDHAMTMLAEHLCKRQSNARLVFTACFAEFTMVRLGEISDGLLE